MTPYEAQFGRSPVLVTDVILNNHLPSHTRLQDISDFTAALRQSAERVNDIIRENTIHSQIKQKENYDRFIKNKIQFRVGDTVKINNYRHRTGLSKAFEPKSLGPYKITEQLGDLNYQLEAPGLSNVMVHYNRMQLYNLRDQFSLGTTQTCRTIKSVVPETAIATITGETPNYSFNTILQSKQLKLLKKRTKEQAVLRVGLITPLINCNKLVPYVASTSSMTLRRQKYNKSTTDSILQTIQSVINEAREATDKSDGESDHETEAARFYISSESESASSNEIEELLNDKGKPITPCPKCGKL